MFTLLILMVVTGCAESKIIDKLGILVAVGYDLTEQDSNDRIRTTVLSYKPGATSTNTVPTSASNNTSKGVREKLSLRTSTKEVIGQLRVAAYGEPLVREGIITLTDTFQRDSEIGTSVYLVVAKDSAEQLLNAKNKQRASTGDYLYELIKKNIESGIVPSPTLHNFLNAYYRAGKDPILPYIEVKGDEILISKLALMKDDRMIGSLNLSESFLVKAMMGSNHFLTHEIELNTDRLRKYYEPTFDKLYVTLSHIVTKSRIKLIHKDTPEFHIQIQLKGEMEEISDLVNLEKAEVIHALEREAEQTLKSEFEDVMKKLQTKQVDPVGFGSHYRSSVRVKDFTAKKWREMLKEARFEYDVKVTFVNVGITS
ncbi:Ger(x)C family spore germination protein [Paenibacillus sp. SC116]|uniref:Ger(x)C family spore germination protein n=1 Tax=Paenibacillus sp. SC116 TaxID=2968986 RepID=UPI00215A6409|nr:Ger(x)C family spore germination protein [Paenibacillus sp. SC116]MCR8842138.1 Ger(x)C family spore germination protein [Paenibacillus sp. SC116]